MSSQYPNSLDSTTNLPTRATGDSIPASDNNDKNTAVIALETKLGTGASPAATASTNAVLQKNGDGTTGYNALTASTISDFQTTVSANTTVTANTTHAGRTDNPHAVTKAQVGLSNVPNVDGTQNKQQAVINTVPSYVLDTFTIHPERWAHLSGGSSQIKDGVMTVTTPANNDTITLDVNFNGNTLLVASDTPLLSFDQAGDKGIVLTNFATNGVNGWQTISLPLAKFTSNFNATTTTAGTGIVLAPNTTVSNLKLRVYESTAGKTLSFRNIVVSDSTKTLKQDFSQPTLFASPKPGSSTWRVQSLDIMKMSKDNVAGQSTDAYMANLMTACKPFNPTHIAVSIPYDSPSAYPGTAPAAGYASRWASAIRTAGRNIFWRQMPLAWEGIYNKPKDVTRGIGTATGVISGSETTTYLAQVYQYIVANPSQYQAGDILCPIPEPENGGITGIVGTGPAQFADANTFRRWLRDSITVTNAALDKIGLRGQVAVGFFGTSGFVVFGNVDNTKGFLDERTLDAMTVLGMDNYTATPSGMVSDLTLFENLYGQFPLMLTEWGTINESTDAARLSTMQAVLATFAAKPYFYGLNYWTIVGGGGNANEDILDWITLAPIGGYANLLKNYTGGAAVNPATHLVTNTGAHIQLNAASGGATGDTLTLLTPGSAAFRTPSVPAASLTGATNKGAVYATTATTATSSAALTDGQLLVGSTAGNPAPATITAGAGITVTNAANSITIASTATGGAPTTSKYILQTADGSLPNAQALGALATGIVKSTTATGILSVAVAADFPTLNQDTTGKSAKTDALNSATTIVNTALAAAPTSGQVLTATSATAATWQTPGGAAVQRACVALPYENLAAYTNVASGSGTNTISAGYLQMQTGTTTGSTALVARTYGGVALHAGMKNINGSVKLLTSTGGGTNGEINYRFFSDNTNYSSGTANQVGLRQTQAGFICSSGNGVTEQTTTLAAPGFAFYTFYIECLDGTSVKFYQDGVLVATHTTAVPTISANRSAIGGAKALNNDIANWQIWIADAGITYLPY
ncbi:MAG: hypothetical protein ACR2OU_05715 [Thermomicrobiales bacterium]